MQWEEECTAAPLSDVLRVHDWNYIKHLQAKCNAIPAQAAAIGRLDMDTAISHASFATALVAAGAVCRAIDAVINQQVSMLPKLLAPGSTSSHNRLPFLLSVVSSVSKQLSAAYWHRACKKAVRQPRTEPGRSSAAQEGCRAWQKRRQLTEASAQIDVEH